MGYMELLNQSVFWKGTMTYVRNLTLLLFTGSVFLFSGCGFVYFDHEPETINKDTIKSLLGSTNEEIVNNFGEPAKEFQHNNKNFLIYEAFGDVTRLLVLGIPYPAPTDKKAQWCILLDFGDNDRLRAYEIRDLRYVAITEDDCLDRDMYWELLFTPGARVPQPPDPVPQPSVVW
jgi:hypothetical protein